MSQRNHAREKPKKRVLVIHHVARLRHDLVEGWVKAGWEVFEAEGREDGLPLMFQLHPDLINLEVVTGKDDSWDALHSIRLLAVTPVVILADGPPPPSELINENSTVIVMSPPVPVPKVISISRAFLKSACTQSLSRAAHSKEENGAAQI
jgi:hypothetical protein